MRGGGIGADIGADRPVLGPPIGNMEMWFREGDLAHEAGSVRFRVLFDPSGKVDRCTILVTTGNARTEKFVYAIVPKRFQFERSHDANGEAAYRILERGAHFGTERRDLGDQSIYTLRVNAVEKPELFQIAVDVDADGALRSCVPRVPDPRREALGAAVCRTVAASWVPLPERNAANVAVRYVRDLSVRLEPAR